MVIVMLGWTYFPVSFIEEPTTIMNVNTGDNVFTIQPYATRFKDKPNGFYPMGVDKRSGTISVSYIAIGKWK